MKRGQKVAKTAKFSDLVSLSNKLFKNRLKKSLILEEQGKPIFNTGAYRSDKADGEYYLFARVSTHHRNYPSWISLYKSRDGKKFTEEKKFFIYPEYTIEHFSYGCEDDRCSKLGEWFVHTYTLLSVDNSRNPRRENCPGYIGISLSKSADKAVNIGFIDIKDDKNAACIKSENSKDSKVYIIHRPVKWSKPFCIWYGDFSEGFNEAKKIYYSKLKSICVMPNVPKIKPPSKNRILLPPLKGWQTFKMGLGAQPLKISKNEYLFTYHVRGDPYQYWWSVGILYEKDNQLKIKKILPIPLCLPDTPWEMIGDVPKVSFLCGVTKNGNMFEAWSGAADTRIIKVEIEMDYLNSVIEKYGIDESEIEKAIVGYVKKNKLRLRKNSLVDKKWLNALLS